MRNENGQALFLTLLTIVFVVVIGLGLLTTTANSNKITVHERQDQSLYYIAEAGINLSKSKIINDIDNIVANTVIPSSDDPKVDLAALVENGLRMSINEMFCIEGNCNKFMATHTNFSLQNGKQPRAEVTSSFSCSDQSVNKCILYLYSKGYLVGDTNKNRELEQKLEINLGRLVQLVMNPEGNHSSNTNNNLLDAIKGYAALAQNTIKIEKKGKIEGNIGSIKGIENVIDLRDHKHTEIVDVSGLNGLDFEKLLPPFPTFPVNPINFSNDNYFNEKLNPINLIDISNKNKNNVSIQSKKGINEYDLIELTSNTYNYIEKISTSRDLEIRIGNGDVYLVVDEMEVKNYDEIIITGEGKLHLIVTKSFSLKDKINPNGNVNSLNMYYTGTNELKIDDGTSYIGGNLVVDKSNVYLKSFGGLQGNLNILKGNLVVDAGSDIGGQLYMNSGNATFNTSSKINEGIFSETGNVTLNSGVETKLIYKKSGVLTINSSVKVAQDIVQKSGTINVMGALDVNNMYLDNVNITFNNAIAPDIFKSFMLNDGIVDMKNDVDFFGSYVQLKGELKTAKQTDFDSNVYLDDVFMSVAESVKFEKNLYIKGSTKENSKIIFDKLTNIEGDFYLLNGQFKATGRVDFYGNIFYADDKEFILDNFVDAKEGNFIIAPKSKVTIIKTDENISSVDIKGTVIAKDIHIMDGYIKYKAPTTINDYYINTPLDSDIEIKPLNNYMYEYPLIER